MAWLARSRLDSLRRRAVAWAAAWARPGLDLLCPPRCGVCGEEPAAEPASAAGAAPVVGVCAACVRGLVDRDDRCLRCGGRCADGRECPRCRRQRPALDGVVVLGAYGDDPLRTAVLRAKRPGGEPVAAALGRLLVSRHRETLAGWRCDAVVPVPMHWSRRALRGTSAATEIAAQVAADMQLPPRALLRRVRATRMQNELPFEERPANVHGAFRSRRGVAGLRILLVDDVVTTGGTLAECRRTLVAAGAASVHAAAAARAERGPDPKDEHG